MLDEKILCLLASALQEEFEVGKSSVFCDEVDFDYAEPEEIVACFRKALEGVTV